MVSVTDVGAEVPLSFPPESPESATVTVCPDPKPVTVFPHVSVTLTLAVHVLLLPNPLAYVHVKKHGFGDGVPGLLVLMPVHASLVAAPGLIVIGVNRGAVSRWQRYFLLSH